MILNRIKNSLSHLKKDAWHRKVVDFFLVELLSKDTPKKACTYWWFAVPGSLVAIGLLCVLVTGALIVIVPFLFVIANAKYALGWIFGLRPKGSYLKLVLKLKIFNNEVHFYDFKEYVTKEGHTKTHRFAPIHYLLMTAGIGALLVFFKYMGDGNAPTWNTYLWILRVLAVIAVLTGIGFLYKKVVHPKIQAACPTITWESE